MTWIHDPYKHRLDGRSYNNRIGRPYYGEKLRRIIEPDVCDPSLVERVSEWWNELTIREARFMVAVILMAVFCAAAIVIL